MITGKKEIPVQATQDQLSHAMKAQVNFRTFQDRLNRLALFTDGFVVEESSGRRKRLEIAVLMRALVDGLLSGSLDAAKIVEVVQRHLGEKSKIIQRG